MIRSDAISEARTPAEPAKTSDVRSLVSGGLAMGLGIMWAWVALHKAFDPLEPATAISWGLGLTYGGAWTMMHSVVLVEWTLGTFLLLGIGRRAALIGSIALLGMYSLFITRLLLLDAPVPCGCGFDAVIRNLSHESQLAIGIVRNCFLMLCAVVSLSVHPQVKKKIGERYAAE